MHNELSPGSRTWLFAAGHIPLHSSGREPSFTSHDKIAILNASHEVAKVQLTIYYSDADPVEGYEIEVMPRRVRKIRFNDLVDPLPIALDRDFGFRLHSSVNVIVQFSRMMTASPATTGFCVTPYHRSV